MLSRSCYLENSSMFDLSIMELFATIVYGWTPLTAIMTKRSVVDLAGYPKYTSFSSNL